MNKLFSLLSIVAVILGVSEAHIYRDHWMNKNTIDPDFMHYKAMAVRSRAAVIREQIKVDHISAKQIDFTAGLDEEIANIQRLAYGFVNGTSVISSSNICADAIIASIDQTFKLIDYRFVFLPDYTIKFNNAKKSLDDFSNTAYVYCNFNQFIAAITGLADPASTSDQGRMVSRVAASMLETWWNRTNCIIDGFLGKNYYDIGYCAGRLFVITFDVSFGS